MQPLAHNQHMPALFFPPQAKFPLSQSLKPGQTRKTGQVSTTRDFAPRLRGSNSPNSSQVPMADPIRKHSVLPKKQLTQSSSRFRQQKVPLDYKPLSLLKGDVTHSVYCTYSHLVCIKNWCVISYPISTLESWFVSCTVDVHVCQQLDSTHNICK